MNAIDLLLGEPAIDAVAPPAYFDPLGEDPFYEARFLGVLHLPVFGVLGL